MASGTKPLGMKRNGFIVALLLSLGVLFFYTSQQLHQHTVDSHEIEGVRAQLKDCQASHGSIKGAATAAEQDGAQALTQLKQSYEARLKKANEELEQVRSELRRPRHVGLLQRCSGLRRREDAREQPHHGL